MEVTEHLHLYTLDVLMRCTFYSNSNCLEKYVICMKLLWYHYTCILYISREEIPYVTASCELEYLLMNRVLYVVKCVRLSYPCCMICYCYPRKLYKKGAAFKKPE